MIKKYKEFLESKIPSLGEKEYAHVSTISGLDLDADYDFHKNITPLINKFIEYFEYFVKVQDSPDRDVRNDAIQKYSDHSLELTNSIKKYLTEDLKSNGIEFRAYYLHIADTISGYIVRFLGTKSDLEKINLYYGIVGDDNIRQYKEDDHNTGWKFLNNDKPIYTKYGTIWY